MCQSRPCGCLRLALTRPFCHDIATKSIVNNCKNRSYKSVLSLGPDSHGRNRAAIRASGKGLAPSPQQEKHAAEQHAAESTQAAAAAAARGGWRRISGGEGEDCAGRERIPGGVDHRADGNGEHHGSESSGGDCEAPGSPAAAQCADGAVGQGHAAGREAAYRLAEGAGDRAGLAGICGAGTQRQGWRGGVDDDPLGRRQRTLAAGGGQSGAVDSAQRADPGHRFERVGIIAGLDGVAEGECVRAAARDVGGVLAWCGVEPEGRGSGDGHRETHVDREAATAIGPAAGRSGDAGDRIASRGTRIDQSVSAPGIVAGRGRDGRDVGGGGAESGDHLGGVQFRPHLPDQGGGGGGMRGGGARTVEAGAHVGLGGGRHAHPVRGGEDRGLARIGRSEEVAGGVIVDWQAGHPSPATAFAREGFHAGRAGGGDRSDRNDPTGKRMPIGRGISQDAGNSAADGGAVG